MIIIKLISKKLEIITIYLHICITPGHTAMADAAEEIQPVGDTTEETDVPSPPLREFPHSDSFSDASNRGVPVRLKGLRRKKKAPHRGAVESLLEKAKNCCCSIS